MLAAQLGDHWPERLTLILILILTPTLILTLTLTVARLGDHRPERSAVGDVQAARDGHPDAALQELAQRLERSVLGGLRRHVVDRQLVAPPAA